MKKLKLITLILISIGMNRLFAQAVDVDVNLNIEHIVDTVSDFGRERHITVHSAPGERDWTGHEDMLDYFINDLDVYFGRDNGSAGWKSAMTTEDPERPHWPDVNSIESNGNDLKSWYESNDFIHRHQYENKLGSMIMGQNPHPVYPSLDWTNFGKMYSGWQTYDVDAAAFFNAHYLDKHFSKTAGEIGEPLPKYWECVNEPDMAIMSPNAMFLSSLEKLFEFHNLSAQEIHNTLGEYSPKVGGMTLGLFEFHCLDKINRWPNAQTTYYNFSDEALYPIYDNMWLGDDGLGTRTGGSTLWQHRGDAWWQWDALYQSFIDACGENMDFYSIHVYDWPDATENQGPIQAGGHVEAMFDLLEWYDLHKYGELKEIIVSEYGSVSPYIHTLPYKRRDWENLRPFNQMFMQFLERPSHIRLTMPFAPVKAQWGDQFNTDGSLLDRYSSTLMDPVGTYTELPGESRYDHADWEWSGMILWYELWSDVKGTRIDTKSSDRDIQVDAYVDGNHVYLILNNLEYDPTSINLNLFDDYENEVQSVHIKHQYLNTSIDLPVNDESWLATAPGSVVLNKSATMILDYEFANPVIIDEASHEYKYMGDSLTASTNTFGSQLCHVTVAGRTPITAHVNGVNVPSIGEATLRIGLKSSSLTNIVVSINGHSLMTESDPVDWRGHEVPNGGYGWFGVFELDIPLEYLQENNEIICTNNGNSSDYTTFQIQTWDFTAAPGRTANGDAVALSDISLPASVSIMQGKSEALSVTFAPLNATNKKITWNSSNTSVATVDALGVVTAVASSGTTTITATSNDGGYEATTTVTATPVTTTAVSGISIAEGSDVEVEYFVTTKLNAIINPANATEQSVVWSSSDDSAVEVVDAAEGKVIGKVLGGTATITATLTDPNNGNAVHTSTMDVTVGIAGDELIYTESLVDELIGNDEFTVIVPANIGGERSITLELIQGESTVLGTGTIDVDTLGRVYMPVTFTTTSVPAMGTNYKFRATLTDGATTVFQGEVPVEMLDIIHVDSITILDWERRVQVGETLPVTADVYPKNAYDTTVSWNSSNTAAATIDANGVVTGVGAGSTIITATTNEGGLETQVTVTVQADPVVGEPTALNITDEVRLFPVTSYSYILGYEPEWTTEREVTWESGNPAIASVDDSGVVTAGSAEGEVTITVTSVSSPDVSATSTVIVTNTLIIEAEDFVSTGGTFGGFARGTSNANDNQAGDWVDYTVNFLFGGDYSIRYYIGAPASISGMGVNIYLDGVLHSNTSLSATGDWNTYEPFDATTDLNVTAGVHTIRIESTANTEDWLWNMDKFELTYQGDIPCAELVSVATPANITVGTGGQRTIQLTTTPVCQSQVADFTWSSDDEDIVTVDQSGVITGVADGTAHVTVESGLFSSTTEVRVEPVNPTSVTVTPGSVNLITGNTVQLSAHVLPDYASDLSVVWSSDNANITVDQDGNVGGTLVGEVATITATSNADNSISGTATITIVEEPQLLTIEAEDLVSTGGTYADGNANNMNVTAVGVNYVNTGDWAEYNLNVAVAGEYEMTYYISCPTPDGNIRVLVDGVEQSADHIPDNGLGQSGWETYIPIVAGSTAILSAGTHTFRIEASGSAWQWNLDKIELLQTCEVINLTINQSDMDLDIDGSVTLTATVNSTNDCSDIEWSSSNTSVATVNSSGIVNPLATGTTTITATSVIDPTISDNIEITVTDYSPASFAVDDVTKYITTDYVSGETIEVIMNYHAETGYTVTDALGGIQVRLLEMDADEITVHNVYTFNDATAVGTESGTSTVTVDLTGVPATEDLVTGRYYALLPRFTSSNGSTLRIDDLSPISILPEPIDVTGVTLNRETDTIKVGETSVLLATVEPADATNQSISWNSDAESTATVVNGVVTGVTPGIATITVTTRDGGYTATAEITVEPVAVEGIAVSPLFDTLIISETRNLTYTITPDTATNQTVTWNSDATSVATVEDGVVTAVGEGIANITVTSVDGSYTATSQITVERIAVEGVTLNSTAESIEVGASVTLVASISPVNATNQNISWSSDVPAVASVTDGVVTGHAEGIAIVTVTTQDGSFTESATITVTDPVNSINENRSQTIALFPNPANHTLTIQGISKGVYDVRILNIQGTEVWYEQINASNSNTILIGELTEGVYILNISNKNSSRNFRFVKNK